VTPGRKEGCAVRTVMVCVAILALAAAAAVAGTANKTGSTQEIVKGTPGEPSSWRADFEYNTGGAIDFVPDLGGSFDGWAEWFVTAVYNNTGQALKLVELGFPCAGPPTGAYGWLVWTDVGGLVPPPGAASTADYFGAFTPVDPNPATFPPITYTYVDISSEDIEIPADTYFVIGYDNTGMGGMTTFNGVATWGWYGGIWDPDADYGRTAILQVKANYVYSPVENASWGDIKALFE
jgi:hypothetical protein